VAKTAPHSSNSRQSLWLFLFLSLLLLLTLSPLLPATGEALPPGNATFTFQYRLFDVDPQVGPSTSRHESNYHLALEQETVNWGNFSGFINWAEEPDYHRQGSWLLEFKDLYFDDTKLDLGFGDNLLRYSLIGDYPFRFSNLVDPDIALEGVRVRVSSGRGELELFAGDIVALRGAFGTGVEYLDETMVGLRSRYSLLPGLRLGCQILRSGKSEQADDHSTTPIFRRNDIYSFSAELEPWPGYRLLQGELSLSHFRKRDEDGKKDQGWDYSLIVGPTLRRPQFTFEANFRHIGADYQPFSRFYASNQEGLFFSGEYRPWGFFSLFASADRYRNNLKDDPDQATIDTGNALLGFRLGALSFPLLSVRYGITDRKSRQHEPSPTDNRLQSYTGELTYTYSGWYPLFRYQRFDYQDQESQTSEYTSDFYFLELRKSFWGGSYGWANGEWNRNEKKTPHSVTDTYSLRLGADYRLFSPLEIRGEVSYSRSKDDLHLADTERKGLLIALSTYLPWNFNLYAEYQYTKTDDKIGVTDRDEHRLYLRVSQRLNWGKPVAKRPVAPGLPPPGYGSIFGYAFDDRNGNGTREKEEAALAGIRVQLEDGTVATSDASGKFSFTNVEMGEHTVALDIKKVPIEYDFPGDPKTKLEVKRRGVSEVDFAFQLLGKMSGKVVEDANGNGRIDEGEKGIANALILLTREGKEFFTYSDDEGNFSLENLRGGTYRIRLDLASVAEGAEITSEEFLAASLPIGGELSDLNFLIHIKPRPVIKKIFGEPEPPTEGKDLPKREDQ